MGDGRRSALRLSDPPGQSHERLTLVHGVAREILDRFFADPSCPDELRHLEPAAYEQADLRAAAELYAAGSDAEAALAFGRAVARRREILAEPRTMSASSGSAAGRPSPPHGARPSSTRLLRILRPRSKAGRSRCRTAAAPGRRGRDRGPSARPALRGVKETRVTTFLIGRWVRRDRGPSQNIRSLGVVQLGRCCARSNRRSTRAPDERPPGHRALVSDVLDSRRLLGWTPPWPAPRGHCRAGARHLPRFAGATPRISRPTFPGTCACRRVRIRDDEATYPQEEP